MDKFDLLDFFIIFEQICTKMKKFILSLFFILFSFISFCQNGGQASENNVLKVEYVGYSNGNHIFKVINKIDCEMGVKIDKNGTTSSQMMTNLQETIIIVSAPQLPQVSIKIKRESGANCKQNPDAGWVELQSLIALPIKFGNIYTTRIAPNMIKLTFDVEEDHTIKSYGIMLSEDGKTFKKITILFPNGTIPHGSTGQKKYSVVIKY